MSSYPSYKIADVRWLDKTPELWQVKPLFAVLRENKLANRGNQEDNVLSLSYGRIIRRDLSQNFGLLPDSFETYQIVNPGDIVLRLTDLQNDKKSLRVGLVKEQGIITSAYTCLVSTPEILPKYAYYLLHAYDLMKVFYNEGAGVRQSMNFRDLRRMPVLIPSLSEQKTIVDFLDRKTAQIDMLIAKKQRQIELLQEQRTAIINQAVTKGLEPYVPMKDSGIEWLGNIPKHWDILRIRWISSIVNGSTPDSTISEYWDGDITWVTPFDLGLQNGKKLICDSSRKITLTGLNNCGASVTPKGSIILSTRAPIGHLAISGSDTCTNQGCKTIVVTQEQFNNSFLYYYLLAFKEVLQSLGRGSTFIELSSSNLKDFVVTCPNPVEQQSIADFLDHMTAQIDELVTKTQKSIDYYQEYRTALITEAVTGKIDVRGEA